VDAARATFDDLVAIMARLRAPGGCPWDRVQTHRSLAPYLLEEAHETLDAIERENTASLREELGDLLLQIVFHAQMAAEAGEFTISDVVAGLAQKLIRRHPHVFGTAPASGPEDVIARWEEIKEEERAHGARRQDGGALDGVPRTLPALMLAQSLQARAARAGFFWPGLREAIAKVLEELRELERAAESEPRERVVDELGDLLFTIANLPRYLGADGELALRAACTKFQERFARLEETARAAGRSLADYAPDELLALWRAAR
jgi:tetrapyrrole methylase family protein / MazG family protein